VKVVPTHMYVLYCNYGMGMKLGL